VSCVEVRERLAEHALGVLTEQEASFVERHLERCVACRKEAAELEHGVETMTFALPDAWPSAALGERVVHKVTGVAAPGRGRSRSARRAIQSLAAATLIAVVVAMGSLGWAVKERNRALDISTLVAKRQQDIKAIEKILQSVGGRPFHVQLLPAPEYSGFGSAIIVSAPGKNNFVLVEVAELTPATGPYTVQVVDRSGKVYSLGRLDRTNDGDLLLSRYTGHDLSKVITVSILDNHSMAVMTGIAHPYANS
jgi:hypothetical protein